MHIAHESQDTLLPNSTAEQALRKNFTSGCKEHGRGGGTNGVRFLEDFIPRVLSEIRQVKNAFTFTKSLQRKEEGCVLQMKAQS